MLVTVEVPGSTQRTGHASIAWTGIVPRPDRQPRRNPVSLSMVDRKDVGLGGAQVGQRKRADRVRRIQKLKKEVRPFKPNLSKGVAPRAGFEPAANRLTAGCSTTQLPGNAR